MRSIFLAIVTVCEPFGKQFTEIIIDFFFNSIRISIVGVSLTYGKKSLDNYFYFIDEVFGLFWSSKTERNRSDCDSTESSRLSTTSSLQMELNQKWISSDLFRSTIEFSATLISIQMWICVNLLLSDSKMSWTTVGVQSNNTTSMSRLAPEITTNKTLFKFYLYTRHSWVFFVLFVPLFFGSRFYFLRIHRSETFCSAQMLKMENLRCARNVFMVGAN